VSSERADAWQGIGWLEADWPAPMSVRAGTTLRRPGQSQAPYAHFNLALHVDDDAATVLANRAALKSYLHLPAEPFWLEQVHGVHVVEAAAGQSGIVQADAAYSHTPGKVCVVMTADCLPVLFCNRAGSTVAAAHAGWRGLADGILEATLARAGLVPADTLAWLGPGIGATVYEVGEEVRQVFIQQPMHDESAFVPHGPGKLLMDMYGLARQRLNALGVSAVFGGEYCSYTQATQFYSYRRDGKTGRMASLIWIDKVTGE